MKKIYIFYLFKKPTLRFLNDKKNSLFFSEITKTNDSSKLRVSFQSKFQTEPEQVSIILTDFLANQNLKKDLETYVEQSYNLAQRLSAENMEPFCTKAKENILSTINSCLLKCQYAHEDIFYFAANIFFNINVTHKLPNGNKRLATALLIKLLYILGYYFKFQGDEYEEYRDWEQKCVEYITRSENKENTEGIISDIREWIIKNIVIALNFRQ